MPTYPRGYKAVIDYDFARKVLDLFTHHHMRANEIIEFLNASTRKAEVYHTLRYFRTFQQIGILTENRSLLEIREILREMKADLRAIQKALRLPESGHIPTSAHASGNHASSSQPESNEAAPVDSAPRSSPPPATQR